MENLIQIQPHKDAAGKHCLKVSLTIDGAELIHREGVSISDMWDNEPDKDGKKMLFSPKTTVNFKDEPITIIGGTIYSTVLIPQEDKMHMINVYNTLDLKDQDLIQRWQEDVKFEAIYYPSKDNETKMNEVRAKLGANHWAVYSDEKLNVVALETNERHQLLKGVFEKVTEAVRMFRYKNYKQDDKYQELLEQASDEIEKEMDYCIEKMSIVKMICGNDYNSSVSVSKLYKKYRGVVEEKPQKLNVQVIGAPKTTFTFDYEPLGWKDVDVHQTSKEEALKVIKGAVMQQLIITESKEQFDETKVVITKEEPYDEHPNKIKTEKAQENTGTPDSQGQTPDTDS